MVDYGKVRSTVKPDEIVIDEFSVWQHTNIQEVSETGKGKCGTVRTDHADTDCFDGSL